MFPPSCDHAVVVARQDRKLLLLAHRPLVEIGALVGLEALAVGRLHQRHAEHVQVITDARLVGVEYRGAGDVHVGFSSDIKVSYAVQYRRIGLSTSSLRCSSGVAAMCGMKSTSRPSSGMWSLRFGCGQSVPHSTRSGKLDHAARERHHVVVARRPGFRQPLGATDLAPYVRVLAHQAHEALEFRTIDRLAHVRAGPCDRPRRWSAAR